MKRRVILALVTLLALALALPAAAAVPEKAGGFGYFSLGSSALDLTDLNAKLHSAPYNYSTIENGLSFGGGGLAFIDRLVFGGEGYAVLDQTVTNGTYNAEVGAGTALFRLGYVAYESETFRLYPLGGIGLGVAGLHIQNRNVPADFDGLLTTPGQETTVESYHLLLDLGIGADRLIKLGEAPEGEGHLVLGLRAGYTWSPASSQWHMDDTTMPGGPSVSFTGPYVRLVIGAGGSGRVVIPPMPAPGETK